jgi:NAD(P)-dependent dehydrogenase (short-subunit alcohol dehydrogenase family)
VTQRTRSVASEVGKNRIRVNSISPGGIATGIFEKVAGVEGEKADKVLGVVKEMFSTLQPIPRSGATDDVANAAVFLASDRSSFIHGHDLVVDGGVSLAGEKWENVIELRASLYAKIKQIVDRLND